MRVLLIPGYRGNPYLAELAAALRAEGVEAEIAGGLGPASTRARARLFARQDVVHLHWTHGYLEGRSRRRRALGALRFLASVAFARASGTRFVWTVHNVFAHQNPDVPLERAFSRVLVALASRCIVHCDAAAREIGAAYGLGSRSRRKIDVIPHAHYVDSYPEAPPRAEARRRFGLDADALVFLHFGQLRAYKGVDALLDAFAGLGDPHARLVVAGKPKSGGYARRIAERAAAMPGVSTFLDTVPDEEVGTYMGAADAVVLPYERILTSGTAVLAMSFGRAVVTPDLGCAQEMLAAQPELLYDASAPGALEGALRRAASADLDSIGAANLDAARRMGWDAAATATARSYAAALRRRAVVGPPREREGLED